MTTFQAIVYAILRGFTEFLPVAADAHQQLVPFFTHGPVATGPLQGALSLGAFLALLLYFRHDWASQISCTLQVILFRRRPMTLDERMPLFLLIATLPVLILNTWIRESLLKFETTPLTIAATLAVFGLLMLFTESMNRRNKGMFDWNWLDALVVGILQLTTAFVGVGALAASWTAAMIRNYNREAAAKFSLFTLAPLLAVQSFQNLHGMDFHAVQPMEETSWLSFFVAVLVSLLVSLLAIGGFLKHTQRNNATQYVVYRWVVAVAAAGWYFYRMKFEN